LGYEQLVNWAFQCDGEDDFVSKVLQDQPEPPVYFAEMKRMNRDGPAILDRLPEPTRMAPEDLHGLVTEGGIVVDTRARNRFAEGHIPGTINVPLDNAFPNWCGWMLPYDRPICFIVDDADRALEAARDLAFIGIDNSAGFFDAEALEYWAEHHGALETTTVIDWQAAEEAVAEENALLLDVRKLTEWNEGHAPNASHIHLGYLRGRVDELPRDRPVLVYCRTGHRSGIGTSVLQAEGFTDVRNVDGGIVDRTKRGLPVE
jgi:hydroxyacylglutathione hydrolase